MAIAIKLKINYIKMEKLKIVEVLEKELTSVYCDSCVEKMDTDVCDGCHRKAMNWGISPDYADYLAEKIIKNNIS